MKKVKLTTMTLALLAGTVVAPIVSTAAELEKQATVSSTEVVKDEVKGEADSTEPVAPETKDEPKGEVAQPTTPETAKPEAKTPAAPKAEERAELVDEDAELRDAIQAARDEAYARHIAGDISYDELKEIDARIVACQSVGEVNGIITWMNENINPELKAAKEAAIREVDGFEHKISTENRDAYVTRIDAAGTQAQIDAVLVEARAEAAFFDAKLDAKTEVQGLVDGYGFTDADALVFQKRIQLATTQAEIDGIVAEAHAAAELGAMRFEAKSQLWKLKLDGTITQDEYFVYANQVDAATTQAEIDAILANAGEFVDLKEYKKEAYYKLSEMTHNENFSIDDYSEFMAELDAATNKAEVDQVLANANARVALNNAKDEAEETVLELAHAELISSGDYWNAIYAIRAATTIEEVNAAVAEAQAIADLTQAKMDAIREVDRLLGEDIINIEQRDAFVTRIDAATSVEEVNSILGDLEDLVTLNLAKHEAKQIILGYLKEDLITTDEYWEFVTQIHLAPSIEEINAIVAEATKLVEFRQAQQDAKDELFFMLTTGDLVMADYYHYLELVENAETVEAINEAMAAANALVLAREAAVKELDGFYKEELLTLVETNGFKYQIEDVRTAEEVEAIMVEARALADSRRIEEITESTITVNYVDESGKSIKDSESVTKEVGEKHVFEAAAIEGYELQGPSSLELTFSDAPQTITFSYKKVDEAKKEGTITVQYLDKDGKEVKASDKLTKVVGTKEIIEAPSIKGYKVVGPKALSVEYVEADQKVAFTYEKVKDNGGKEEGNGGKGEGNNNKGNENKDNKGNKGESKKEGNKKSELPQTGEAAANAGLVAGGILSMLSAAFVFLRKGK